jgi:hypothetical protein
LGARKENGGKEDVGYSFPVFPFVLEWFLYSTHVY